jgi:hypothetical protein
MKFISITPENNNSAEFMKVNSQMPAFVKLYSPGCGHCVAMQDAWDALKGNAALKDYDMAVIEVHADELDHIKSPAMSVNQGFPTIRKVLKNGNLGKDYEGDRSTADMIKFIKDNFSETHKGRKTPMKGGETPMKGGGKRKTKKTTRMKTKTKKGRKTKTKKGRKTMKQRKR